MEIHIQTTSVACIVCATEMAMHKLFGVDMCAYGTHNTTYCSLVHFDRPQCVTLRFYYIIRTACVFDALKKAAQREEESSARAKKNLV